MNLDKRLLAYLLKLKRPFAGSLFFTLLTSIAVIFQAKLLSRMINHVFLDKAGLDAVMPLLLFFLAFVILRAITLWASQNSSNKIATAVKNDLRYKLLSHLFRLGPAYSRSQQTGELKNTVMSGVQALHFYFSDYLPQLLFVVFIPILILVFVFPADLLSGFIFLFTTPLIPFFMILIGDMAQKRTQKQWLVLSRLSVFFLDVLQGLTTLKILGRSKEQVEKIKSVTNEFRSTTMGVLKIAFLSALVLEMLATISTAIIAVEIGLRLMYAKMAFEQALFILIVAPEFYQPFRQLGARFHTGMEGFTAAKRIYEILETKPYQTFGTAKAPSTFTEIRFEGVSYTYAGGKKPALSHLNVTIQSGEHIALVGPSGAGKTTLTSLLLRFMDPTSGSILVDGQSLVQLDMDGWRQQIAWVPQNPFLFHKTVAKNLLLANTKASFADLQNAAERAHIDDVFVNLSNGYNTIIGERGARLSGGQAQRLAIARAFLKDVLLIILDEPTSYLDAETEALVQESISDLSNEKTQITIAHRLHTVENADKIVVLDKGRIVDIGRHGELIKRCVLYSNLLNSKEIVS